MNLIHEIPLYSTYIFLQIPPCRVEMSGNENCFPLVTKNTNLGVRLLVHGEKMPPHEDFKGTSLIKLHLKVIPITAIY